MLGEVSIVCYESFEKWEGQPFGRPVGF